MSPAGLHTALGDRGRGAPGSRASGRRVCKYTRIWVFFYMNLTLLIDAEHERLRRRMEIEADDVAHLLDKKRIRRNLEGPRPVGLDAKEREIAMDAALADATLVGRIANRPVRRVRGFRLHDGLEHAGHRLIRVRPRPSRSWRVIEAGQAVGAIALPPERHERHAHAEPARDRRVRVAGRRAQHDLRAAHQAVGEGA